MTEEAIKSLKRLGYHQCSEKPFNKWHNDSIPGYQLRIRLLTPAERGLFPSSVYSAKAKALDVGVEFTDWRGDDIEELHDFMLKEVNDQ